MRPAPAQQPGGSCGQNAGEGPPAPVGYPGHGVTAPATGAGPRGPSRLWGGVPASPASRGSGSATRRRRSIPRRTWARRSASICGANATTAPGWPWAATRCAGSRCIQDGIDRTVEVRFHPMPTMGRIRPVVRWRSGRGFCPIGGANPDCQPRYRGSPSQRRSAGYFAYPPAPDSSSTIRSGCAGAEGRSRLGAARCRTSSSRAITPRRA